MRSSVGWTREQRLPSAGYQERNEFKKNQPSERKWSIQIQTLTYSFGPPEETSASWLPRSQGAELRGCRAAPALTHCTGETDIWWTPPPAPSVVAHGTPQRSKPERTVQVRLSAQLVFCYWKGCQVTKRWNVALQRGVGEIPRTGLGKQHAAVGVSPPLATTSNNSQNTTAALTITLLHPPHSLLFLQAL